MDRIYIKVPIFFKMDSETPDGRTLLSSGFQGFITNDTPKLYALDVQGIGGHIFARITGGWDTEATQIHDVEDGKVVSARAYIMADDFGIRMANLIDQGLLKGMSVDLADDFEEQVTEVYDSETDKWSMKRVFTRFSAKGGTIVEDPAFPDAFVELEEPLAPEYKYSIQLADNPDKAAEIEAELQGIIESARTETSFVRVKETYTPPEVLTYPLALFQKPTLRQLTPFQYDRSTGRINGHLAGWRTAHAALPNAPTPPRSRTEYRYFANIPVETEEGERVWVGRLVCDTQHAKIRGINAEQAMAHYASTGSVFGLVAIGEDEHGIWVSGAAVKIDPELLTTALACPPSGDWRPMKGVPGRELIAGLAVAVPGYNTPRPYAEFSSETDSGLIISNVMPDKTTQFDTAFTSRLDKVFGFVEKQMQREEAEAARRAEEIRRAKLERLNWVSN